MQKKLCSQQANLFFQLTTLHSQGQRPCRWAECLSQSSQSQVPLDKQTRHLQRLGGASWSQSLRQQRRWFPPEPQGLCVCARGSHTKDWDSMVTWQRGTGYVVFSLSPLGGSFDSEGPHPLSGRPGEGGWQEASHFATSLQFCAEARRPWHPSAPMPQAALPKKPSTAPLSQHQRRAAAPIDDRLWGLL